MQKSCSGLKNTAVALTVNAAAAALIFALTPLCYETNDDFMISEMISTGFPNVGFVSVYLCKLLVLIQNHMRGTNVFVLTQLVLSCIAFSAVFKTVIDRSRSIYVTAIALAAILVFSFDHYSIIQFTKTSALLMTSGLIVLVNNHIGGRHIISYMIGFILFYLGVAFRQKGMFPAIAYAAVFMLLWWFAEYIERKHCDRRQCSTAAKIEAKKKAETGHKIRGEILSAVFIIVMLLVPYGLDMLSDAENISTPELSTYRAFQAERMKITDYPVMDNYEDASDEYDEAGISENDLRLVSKWFFDYEGVASTDRLRCINSINGKYREVRSVQRAVKSFVKHTLKDIENLSFTGMHIIMMLMLFVCILLCCRKKAWGFAVFTGLLTAAIYTAIFYMQRPQYRALYVADTGAVFWLIYILAGMRMTEGGGKRIVGKAISLITAAVMIAMMIPAAGEAHSQERYTEKIVESKELSEYFEDHADIFFLGPATTMPQPRSYLDPLEEPERHPNVSDTGGWETLSPYKNRFLESQGIKNPIKDIINNENACYCGPEYKDSLTEYYNKWYSDEYGEIHLEKTDEIEGMKFYRVKSR